MKLNLRSFAVPPLLGNGTKAAVAAIVVTVMGAAWSGTKHASHFAVAHAQQVMFPEPQQDATSHATALSSCAAGQAAGV